MRNNLVSAVPGTIYGVTREIEELGKTLKGLERHARSIDRLTQRFGTDEDHS